MHPTRKAIIDVAKSCLGTPFQHQGRQKGLGLDCIGLVRVPVMEIPELLCWYKDNHNFTAYGMQPVPSEMRKRLREYFEEIPIDKAKPGDILWFKIRRDPQHVGILVEGNMLIHSISNASGRVVQHVLDDKWKNRIVAAFKYRGIDD